MCSKGNRVCSTFSWSASKVGKPCRWGPSCFTCFHAGRQTYRTFHAIKSHRFYDRVIENIVCLARCKHELGIDCMLELAILLDEINAEHLDELIDTFTESGGFTLRLVTGMLGSGL